jgi:hypothetical protein
MTESLMMTSMHSAALASSAHIPERVEQDAAATSPIADGALLP